VSSDLDNFLATVEHRRPGRILYHASFTPDLKKRLVEHIGSEDIAAYYGLFHMGGVGLRRPQGAARPDYSAYWEDQDLPDGTTITDAGVALVPAGFYHFHRYVSPLRNARSLSELERYPIEDVSGWDVSDLADQVRRCHEAGRPAIAWVGHMYETAWQIRGYEQFLIDTIERPAWAECLLDRLAEQNRTRAVAYAGAGADCIRCGDDVANQKALMFAPDTWRRLIHSRWAAIWRAVKDARPQAKIWYHSDGNVGGIVGELVEAGLDILNPVQPECLDLDDLHRRFGDRLTFDGTIGTQSTMPFGTPAAVRARVREVIDKYGRDGGLIVSPTHVLEPEVPIDNIDALFTACRDYGTFE
jgi:uroporphyrinogen decarboxylase